jgi:hypothetical protein
VHSFQNWAKRGMVNELCAGGRGFGSLFLSGSSGSGLAFSGLCFFDGLYSAIAGAAAAVAAATSAVAAAATAIAATAIATAVASTVLVPATMLVAAAGVATGIAAGIAARVTGAFATTVAAAFAGRGGFAAFGLLLTALSFARGLASIVMTVMAVMTGTTAKTSKASATTMAGFRLILQTHENNGKRRQTQGHAH